MNFILSDIQTPSNVAINGIWAEGSKPYFMSERNPL